MTSTEETRRLYWLAGNREPAQDVFFTAALDKALWQPGTKENWDTCWYTGMPNADVFECLDESKTINHIPGNNGVTIKNYLYETLSAARARLSSPSDRARMDFFPRVYSMPNDYHALQQCAAQNPGKKWILKPKNSSRGRGIEVVQDIADIPLDNKWMVQEYIDNPHVMNERKYVLRLYVLVTSVEPLRVYLYREGFAKLASEPYNIEDPDNPFSHLTNPDVNATNTDADAPVVFVSFAEYRKWLCEEGHDDEALFAKINDLVTLTVISVREHMRKRVNAVGASTRGCYELLGIDCLVDAQLKPWILECNLSPSLEVCAGPEDDGGTEERIKSGMVADMVSLVGINAPLPDRKGLSRAQCIHLDAAGEMSRAGDFQRLFPAKDTAEDYLRAFPVPRYADVVSATDIMGKSPGPAKLTASQTTEIVSDEELALYFEKNRTLYTPNQIAGWIWLKTTDGVQPQEIADALLDSHEAAHGKASDEEKWLIRENVWDVLSNWAQLGLLQREDSTSGAADTNNTPSENAAASWQAKTTVKIGERVITLDYGCAAVAMRLAPLFAPLETDETSELTIAIQQGQVGYALAIGPVLVATGLGLDNVGQMVSRALFEKSPANANQLSIAGSLIPIGDGEAIFCAAPRENSWEDALALQLSAKTKMGVSGGMRVDPDKPNMAMPIGLALRLNKDDAKRVEKTTGLAVSPHLQNWSNGEKGHLVAANLGDGAAHYRLRTIILPVRENGEAALDKPKLETVSVHKALEALLISAKTGAVSGLSGAQVLALSEWLGGSEVQSLHYADPEDAANILAKAFT